MFGLSQTEAAAESEPERHRLSFPKNNQDLLRSLGNTVQVGGGTAWLWAREEAKEEVDILFVEEAAQMS